MSVERNDIILFTQGRDGKPVAYDSTGKVILCKHAIDIGYARVTSVEERSNVFLITAEPEYGYDYYEDIEYAEFKEVLKRFGFKIGFERPFKYQFNESEPARNETQLFAYNTTNNCVIVAVTYRGFHFNGIDLYCPGIRAIDNLKLIGFSFGCDNITGFDLCCVRGQATKNLISRYMSRVEHDQIENGKEWPISVMPSTWTYADNEIDFRDEDDNWALGKNTLSRLAAAPKEATDIFKNCTNYEYIFK